MDWDFFEFYFRTTMAELKERTDATIQTPHDSGCNYRRLITERKTAAQKEELECKEEWIANGHGEYSTLTSMEELRYTRMKSKNVVVHIYCTSNMHCAILDKHLSALAPQHIETKFCKLDFELARSYCEGKGTDDIPAIFIYKESFFIDWITDFDEIGGIDNFSTEMMEYRLAKSEIINYFGDFLFPPDSEVGRRDRSFIEWMEKVMRDTIEGRDSDDITEDRDGED